MIELLIDNPFLLLFIIVAIGYPIGQIKIGRTRIGVASVLFAGIAIGSLHPDLIIPEEIYLFGLLIFIYTIGLSSGPSFFASFQRKGLRDNIFVAGMIGLGAIAVLGVAKLLNLTAAMTAGLFAGSLTNTPALAAILQAIQRSESAETVEQLLAEPVVAYSIVYPIGVLGMLLAINFWQRRWQIDYALEAEKSKAVGVRNQKLQNHTIRVTNTAATQRPLFDLRHINHWDVNFGRIQHDGTISLSNPSTQLAVGDLISVVGEKRQLETITNFFGEPTKMNLELDRSDLDYRRMVVSNSKVAGHRLKDLNLPQQFGAYVTRLRRGDVEFLPHGDTTLELGDRVRVVAKRSRMQVISDFFGDSYRTLSEIDILTFSIGLCLGLFIGTLPITLPGGFSFQLGMAGGPLIVALILSGLGRTGPFVWTLPYSANLTLRQMGLILFLAGIGTRAGYIFGSTFVNGGGLQLFFAGAIITTTIGLVTLWIGYRVLNIPFGVLTGMLAGLQTQPAVLGYALEQANNEMPNIGYATVFPVATITKILVAQLLLGLV